MLRVFRVNLADFHSDVNNMEVCHASYINNI